MPIDEVALAMAKWQLAEFLPAADVQKLAIRLLEEGRSSPALYELAGTPAFALGRDLDGLVEQMFNELDVQRLTDGEATLLLAQQIADDIVNGRIEPYEGARRIWMLSDDLDDTNRRAVRGFIRLAATIEDQSDWLAEGERQIKEEAARFLAER